MKICRELLEESECGYELVAAIRSNQSSGATATLAESSKTETLLVEETTASVAEIVWFSRPAVAGQDSSTYWREKSPAKSKPSR